MSSTSISSVLFALLILILQTLTTVSALPTCTPAAGTGAQLETRASDSNENNNNSGSDNSDSNDTTASNEVTSAQIAGVVIGALCTIALALIFWYCFVQHQQRKRDQRALGEKTAAIENTKRADPSYESARGIDRRPLV
ncbi:hypothetical protein HOY80DRAFT_674048 [Tuber brumale]|nr:hypothetical protein HOY80DRAFT_674048 [Tuber brumale]